MFDTVLVANRGEIAVRIIATLRRLGIRSAAIFSDADAEARHVREADLAFHVGATPASESYLNVERVVAAARRAGADALHPGYGFLSENAALVRACEAAGVTFVGPRAHAVEVMGDKIRARDVVAARGVAVVPGCAVPGLSDAQLCAAAPEVGFPLLVKPSAGGGGKGMRVVHAVDELAGALASARREAAGAFGDDALFLERYLPRPRHLEVQILADVFGTFVHLGERECSLQRRHQKVIEESPSPHLDGATRERMCAAALDTGRAVDYLGVGTVEFIVSADQPDEFFFMEMNTRLQVEHPVTEMVTGIDLVEAQLRVAAGEPLSYDQAALSPRGHSVEARVYAEDPDRDFLPTGGEVIYLREPRGEGLRVDSSLDEGARVGTSYDPLVAKYVAHGSTRDHALARLDQALASSMTLGVNTNVGFLRRLLADENVRTGHLDTGLIARVIETELVEGDVANVDDAWVALVVVELARCEGVSDARFDVLDGWRIGEASESWWHFTSSRGEPLDVGVRGTWREMRCRRASDDTHAREVRVSSLRELNAVTREVCVDVDGRVGTYVVAARGDERWVHDDGGTRLWRRRGRRARDDESHERDGEVRSPMPGVVSEVRVAPGDSVSRGELLVVVEAMKMEHALAAPRTGRLREVNVRVGDQVVVDQLLACVEGEDSSPAAPQPPREENTDGEPVK